MSSHTVIGGLIQTSRLNCGKAKLNDWATSMSFIGLFLGALVAGFCSDKFGRKVTIMVAVALNAALWIAQSYIPGYYAFVVLRILVQAANQASYLTYVCYSCEVVGPS